MLDLIYSDIFQTRVSAVGFVVVCACLFITLKKQHKKKIGIVFGVAMFCLGVVLPKTDELERLNEIAPNHPDLVLFENMKSNHSWSEIRDLNSKWSTITHGTRLIEALNLINSVNVDSNYFASFLREAKYGAVNKSSIKELQSEMIEVLISKMENQSISKDEKMELARIASIVNKTL
ncbi:hypothetical protein A3715_10215 [Oleiphilus sp. HI0009]|nr:hypothetical protein A3715_10215 [Oleiphilus sp. HI0009]